MSSVAPHFRWVQYQNQFGETPGSVVDAATCELIGTLWVNDYCLRHVEIMWKKTKAGVWRTW